MGRADTGLRGFHYICPLEGGWQQQQTADGGKCDGRSELHHRALSEFGIQTARQLIAGTGNDGHRDRQHRTIRQDAELHPARGRVVVFPRADVKIYLDASAEERARRRAADPAHSGGPTAIADVATALSARDEIDRTRTASPLVVAADAIRIDTTSKPVDQVVAEVLAVINARI